MLDQDERTMLKELFEAEQVSITNKIQYEERRYPPKAFAELCSDINNSYLRYTISPPEFIELLELYVEFFKEATLNPRK